MNKMSPFWRTHSEEVASLLQAWRDELDANDTFYVIFSPYESQTYLADHGDIDIGFATDEQLNCAEEAIVRIGNERGFAVVGRTRSRFSSYIIFASPTGLWQAFDFGLGLMAAGVQVMSGKQLCESATLSGMATPALLALRRSAKSVEEARTGSVKRIRQTLRRVCSTPFATVIAFVGPDGAGKSTLIEMIRQHISSRRIAPVTIFHLRPKLLPRRAAAREGNVSRINRQKTYRNGEALAKAIYVVIDYWLGYLFRVWPRLLRGHVVIFDRHYIESIADPGRFGYPSFSRIASFIRRTIPTPDFVVVVVAAPDVLLARTDELSDREATRLAEAYVDLPNAANLQNALVVMNSTSCEDALTTILRELARDH